MVVKCGERSWVLEWMSDSAGVLSRLSRNDGLGKRVSTIAVFIRRLLYLDKCGMWRFLGWHESADVSPDFM